MSATTKKADGVISTGRGDIPYVLTRSRKRRRVSITIDQQACVKVAAPFFVSETAIVSFIEQKKDWIVKHYERAAEHKSVVDKKKFVTGGQFIFQGQFFSLKVVLADSRRGRIDFDGEKWTVAVPVDLTGPAREKFVQEEMVDWYRQQAEEILGGRVFHYARILNVMPEKITVRTQKHLWGSCHYGKKSVNLNWKLVMMTPDVMDYVVVHELCHLIHPNHSAAFWKEVGKIIPDLKARQKWLKDNRPHLSLP